MDRLERGNLVTLSIVSKTERPHDLRRIAVVEYSYNQKYGDGSNSGDYSIIWLDNGCSESWFSPNQLELIDVGGEYLIDKALKTKEEIRQRDTDLQYIKDNWNRLTKEGFSSTTMLFLFHKLDFTSSFERNGEYFILFYDWDTLFPLYNFLFTGTGTDRDKLLNVQSNFKDNVISLFDEIQAL